MASQYNTTVDPETIALIDAANSITVISYCNAAVAVFVIYDWAVTLTREVQLFWTRKARPLSAALYFSNRYVNMCGQVLSMVLIWDVWMPSESCTGTVIASLVVAASYLASPAVFAGLRAYALTQLRWLSVVIFLLSFIPFAANLARVGFKVTSVQDPIAGCVYSTTFPSFLVPIFTIMDRVSIILADTALVIITWKRVAPDGAMKASRQIGVAKRGLASVLLRDELSVELDDYSSSVGLFTSSLSSVLVSHFLLDLQEAHQRKVVALASDDPLHTSQSFSNRSVRFMPALGSLAATINPADYGGQDGDEDFFEASEDLSARPDSGVSSEDVRGEDELAITEVSRSGDAELAIEL